jgi:hypothetical protein
MYPLLAVDEIAVHGINRRLRPTATTSFGGSHPEQVAAIFCRAPDRFFSPPYVEPGPFGFVFDIVERPAKIIT